MTLSLILKSKELPSLFSSYQTFLACFILYFARIFITFKKLRCISTIKKQKKNSFVLFCLRFTVTLQSKFEF